MPPMGILHNEEPHVGEKQGGNGRSVEHNMTKGIWQADSLGIQHWAVDLVP